MLDKGLNAKPVRLIAFTLLVKVNFLGPEGRRGFLSVRCFNHRENTFSAGQPRTALTRRNLLNAPRRESVAFFAPTGCLQAGLFALVRFSWNHKAASRQTTSCHHNVAGLQLTQAEGAAKTSVAFSSSLFFNSLTPSCRLTCVKAWGAPQTPCTHDHVVNIYSGATNLGRRYGVQRFIPCMLERRERGGTKKKSMKISTLPPKKGMWSNAQLWAMSTLIGFVLIAKVWTVGTKYPASHFNPPQALFFCGLLLFSPNIFFLPRLWVFEKTKIYWKDKKMLH